MSTDDARDDFERIEDEAERSPVRLVAIAAGLITIGWLAAIVGWLPELINKL